LREDLQVSHKTLAHWADILERMYAIFRLRPLSGNRLRAVKKEQKHYHTDWTLITDPAQRFENLVASHLLKWVHFEQDTKGRSIELCYFRDTDKREVDFVIVEDEQPIMLIEAKWSDDPVSPHLKYLKNKDPKSSCFQIHAIGKKDYISPEGVHVTPALKFLSTLV
jgi:predicted AAA+ superfamily ATPase